MAKKKITSISPASIDDLRKGMGTIRNLPPRGPRGTSGLDEERDYLPPEVYIARTPPEGIAALIGDFIRFTGTGTGPTEFGTGTGSCRPGWAGTGTGTGTGAWETDDDWPGWADCQIFRIVDVCGMPTMLHIGKVLRIYNVSGSVIEGDIYVPIMREKFGRWLAVPGGGGGGGIQTLAAGGRLSGSQGFPAQPGDGFSDGFEIIYYVPFVHDRIAIWNGSEYVHRRIAPTLFSTPSVDVSGDVDTTFDVYASWNGAGIELSYRDRVIQDVPHTEPHERYGVWIKLNEPTYRYLGTGRRGSDGLVYNLDPTTNYLWNIENKIPVAMFTTEEGHSFSSGSQTWNGKTPGYGVGANSLSWVIGISDPVGRENAVSFCLSNFEFSALTQVKNSVVNGEANWQIAFDDTTAPMTNFGGSFPSRCTFTTANAWTSLVARIIISKSSGYHWAIPIENTTAVLGTVSWTEQSISGIGWF